MVLNLKTCQDHDVINKEPKSYVTHLAIFFFSWNWFNWLSVEFLGSVLALLFRPLLGVLPLKKEKYSSLQNVSFAGLITYASNTAHFKSVSKMIQNRICTVSWFTSDTQHHISTGTPSDHQPWWTKLPFTVILFQVADSFRVADDMGKLRCQLTYLNRSVRIIIIIIVMMNNLFKESSGKYTIIAHKTRKELWYSSERSKSSKIASKVEEGKVCTRGQKENIARIAKLP